MSIDRAIASVREDRRADYLWDTRTVAQALNVHPNRFHDWWYRTRERLELLCMVDPGNTAAELLAIVAAAEARRQREARESAQKVRTPHV
jgi:hypothetical protein